MVDLLKKIFFSLLLTGAFMLSAAVDERASYFKVSNHQPGINSPVTVDITLRDSALQLVDAKKIVLSCDKSCQTSAVQKVAPGKYRGTVTFTKAGERVTLTVIADGVKVRENLMDHPDDLRFCTAWTSRLETNEMRRFADRLEIVSLDRKSNASWNFATLEGNNYLHDRKYRLSAEAELKELAGHGIVVVGGERNQAGKEQQGPHYGTFLAGNRTVKLERDIQPRKWGVKLSFGASVMTADGMAIIRYPRVEALPTFVTQAQNGIKITPNFRKNGYDRFARSYAKAAAAGYEKLLAMPENKDLKAKITGNISAYTALEVRRELAKRAKLLEEKGAAALRKQLREAAFKTEVKAPFGKNINAMVMRKVSKAPVLDGNLNEWQGFSGGFKSSKDKTPAPSQTEVAAAYDENNLYLAIRMHGKIGRAGNRVPHDGDEIWRSDNVEIFVVPEHGSGYYQLAVGANGQSYDGADGDGMVNFPWKKAYKVNADNWCAEVAIPWKSVGFSSVPKEFRGNICRSIINGKSSCWSIHSRGYSEAASMGFIVADNFGKAKDAATFIALKNEADMARQRQEIAASEKARKQLSGSGVIFSLWDEEKDFEKDPNFQVRFISERMKKSVDPVLEFKQAVNEFAHRSFIVSAIAGAENMQFVCSDLVSADGKKIPAKNLSVWQIGFLEPDRKYWPDAYNKWSKRPLPELVEEVDSPVTLEEFQSIQFRLLIDSRKAQPGKYTGKVTVKTGGRSFDLPVNCEVMDFALPDVDNHPYRIYIFSALPYSGKSGEAWAKLYKEHYVTDISFEHPQMTLDGKIMKIPGWRTKNYIDLMINWKQPAGSKFAINGKLHNFDDRVAICARWGLKVELTNRTGAIYVDLMPQLDAHLKSLGIKPGQWGYKLGDEDHSPWLVPLAKAIRKAVPDAHVSFIPAGYEYWDLKPVIGAFTQMTYSRAAMTINAQGEKDLKYIRQQGVNVTRYTNRTSWTERAGRFAGRLDLWDVIIKEGLDGFCVWTASPYVTLNHGLGYGSAYKVPIHNYPPENQSTTQLIYIRKKGDFYKPVSCIRLEDMRDGVTDALYYREALKRTAANPAKRAELLKIASRRHRTRADYDKSRMDIAEIILCCPAK